LELDERRKLLGIGSGYLKSAAELFGKTGHRDKEGEVLERLDRVEKEEKILVSALNTIREPSISRSTVGIVAPASPVETSLSPRISEVGQFTEEARRVAEERAKKKYELVYRDLLKEYPRIEKRECRVAIAQIGVSKTGDILSEFYEEKAGGLFSLREDKVETVRSKVKNMVEIAHSKGVNILLFPELAVDLNYGQLLEDVSSLAKAYEMYIIPGSYHDQETKRNISTVIGLDGILWQQEKHIPATIHYEGRSFKEGIEVGTLPRKTIVCNTEFGRIAIAICRDFLDMDLRVELKNFEPPVDIIFNPAFTPVTEDFKAAHFDARRSIYAYCFFANIAEFGDSLIYTPEKERLERTIPPREESLIYKDIDLFKLRSERKKWEKEQGKERPFIQSTR
jgi:predicted amidohydrolase